MDNKENTLIIEDEKQISEILQGHSIDIIFELMQGELSEDELISRLEIHPLKMKIYLDRLIKLGIIDISRTSRNHDHIKIFYELKQKNLELLMHSSEINNSNLIYLAEIQKYNDLIRKGFSILSNNSDKPNKYFAIAIKTESSEMEKFKEKLNILINDFINMEDESKNELFIFIPMFFPFTMEK
jgi:hypothetical protein